MRSSRVRGRRSFSTQVPPINVSNNQAKSQSRRKISSYSWLFFGAILTVVSQAPAAEKYVVGVSNTLVGNGWREEMVCSIKAEALASGKVSKVILANRNGGPSEQIADLRNLISAGVNIIIVNPSDRKALDPVIKQAT